MRLHIRRSPSRTGLLRPTLGAGRLATIAVGVLCAGAWAQPAADARAVSDDELAWALSRTTLLDLASHESPTPEDYALAGGLLSVASDLSPGDNELARSLVRASWLAGDQATMIEATRRVIRNDPADTVAQLRLVSSIINQKQTAEERMVLYERFLGDDGRSLDPSVRSRLALDAALLERERGNARAFVERLHQATRLDVSNKAAASLAAQYYASASDDAVTVLDYQIRLLNADPLDANVHLTIASLLASHGAYLEARRFLGNASDLFQLETGAPPAMIDKIKIALDWEIDGPSEFSDRLTKALRNQRGRAQQILDKYHEASLPTDELIKPEDIRYDLDVDKFRLFAAYNLGDEALTREVLNDIATTVSKELAAIGKLAGQRGADQNTLLQEAISRITDLQVMRAIVGLDADKIRSDTESILKNQPAMAAYLSGIEPMALYAEGSYERALEASEPYRGSPIVSLIRAQSYEKLGRKEEALELYLNIARDNALNAYGAFANSRVLALDAGDRLVTAAGRQMMQIVQTIPGWLDDMISRPDSFMYLSVTVLKGVYPAMEQPMLRIKLQNTAPIPMAVGPSAPIDSRMLVIPKIDSGLGTYRGKPAPKVVELDQRLRLRPREELTVTIRADSAHAQWLMGLQANSLIRERYRVLQGFRPRTSDASAQAKNANPKAPVFGITNSPLGLTAETGLIQRMMLDESRVTLDELIARLASGVTATRRAAVMASAGRLWIPQMGAELDPDQQQRLVAALMETYTRVRDDERAWMMLVLPHRRQVPAMIDFDDHVASSILSGALIDSRVDPLVLCAALLTRTDDAEAPIFETLSQVSDPRVRRVAQILRSRLRDGRPTYSTMDSDVDSMLPGGSLLGF